MASESSTANGAPMEANDLPTDVSALRSGQKYNIPEGLGKSKRKNLKKKLREKEKKAEEAAGIRRDAQRLEDPLQAERAQVLQSALAELVALPSLSEMKPTEVLEQFRVQQDILQSIFSNLDEALESFFTKVKRPDNRRLTSSQLLDRIRELSALAERDDVAIEYLEAQLAATVSWENARKFQTQIGEVRQKVEDRQRVNVRSHEGARAWERKTKLVDRLKQLKLLQATNIEDVENITASKIVTVELEVNPDAQLVLLPPLNLYRRMERLFGVSVDRSPDRNRQRTFILSGLEKDVNEAVAFIQQADFSGGFKVAVESRLMPQLIGRGGVGIRQLEDTYKCFYQTRENNEVVIYGATSNAAKAAQHISQLKAERQSDQTVAVIPIDHPAICRALTGVFIKKLREIEAKNNVSVRASAGPPPNAGGSAQAGFGADVSKPAGSRPSSGSPAPRQGTSVLGGPTVTIRGSAKPAVEEARKEVVSLVSGLRTMEIPVGSAEALRRLFFRVSFNGEVDISRGQRSPTRGAQPGVGDKFCDLVGSNDSVAFLRHGDGLALVGTPEDLEKLVEEVRTLTEVAGYTSSRVKVAPQQMPVLSVARLAEISEATGASVTTRRARVGESDAVSYLDVLGSDSQKADAEKMIETILAREGVVKIRTLEYAETVNKLLRDRASMIRALEANYGTRISVDRTRLTCTIVGGPHGVEATEEALEAVEAKIASLVTRVVPIPSADMIGLIVGARGSNISAIRARSEVESLDIDDKEMTVTLRGSEDQVQIAEEMLRNIFTSSRRPTAQSKETPSTATSAAGPSPLATPSRPGRTTPQFGVGWGESVIPEDDSASSTWEPPRQQGTWMSGAAKVADSASPAPNILGTAFPTLDEVDELAFKKPRRRRRGARATQSLLDDGPVVEEKVAEEDAQSEHEVLAEPVSQSVAGTAAEVEDDEESEIVLE